MFHCPDTNLVIHDSEAYYLLTKSVMPGFLGEGEARVSFRIVELMHTCSSTNHRVRPHFRKILEQLENKLSFSTKKRRQPSLSLEIEKRTWSSRDIYFTGYTISLLYLFIISNQVLLLSKDFLRSKEDTIHDNDKPGAQINSPGYIVEVPPCLPGIIAFIPTARP